MKESQYVMTRKENKSMVESLQILQSHFRIAGKRIPIEDLPESSFLLKHLEHVLEFSATWNGVPTKYFFPDTEEVQAFLETQDVERLGSFFERPFAETCRVLREAGIEYPPLLRAMYESYYLRRSMASKTPHVH